MVSGARLLFIDCETSGLDPSRHQLFELGIIDGRDEYRWWFPIDRLSADESALRVSRYYQRHPGNSTIEMAFCWSPERTDDSGSLPPSLAAAQIAKFTAGAQLVGVNPSFDAAFMRSLLRNYSFVPAWDYHLVDVLALAAGKLTSPPPWSSRQLSEALGVKPSSFDRHTALGDARWAKAMYEAVMA